MSFRLFAVLFVLSGTIVLSFFSFFQQSQVNSDLVFLSENRHDALWHLALMSSVTRSISPENPLVSGEQLVGYHYFNDVLWVLIHFLTGISLVMIYLKVAPVILAFLFSATTLWLFLSLFKKKIDAFLGAAITVFGSGFAYLVPLFFSESKATQSVFWLDQPVHLVINQQLLLSLSIVNLVLYLLYTHRQKQWKTIGLLVGGVLAIKVYASLVLLGTVSAVGSWEAIKFRSFGLWKIFGLGLVVGGFFVWLIGSSQGFPFWWQPGWFFKTMFESGDRLNFVQWEMFRQEAALHHSLPRLVVLWSIAFVLFFIGNFGVKLLGFFFIPFVLRRVKKEQQVFWLCLVVMMLISFAMPTLFLQKGLVWNTIQFLPYAYVPLGLLLTKGVEVFGGKKHWSTVVLVMLLLLSLPTTIQSLILDSKPSSYSSISADLVQQIQALSTQHPEKTILVDSTLQHESIIPAFAGKSVYYAEPEVLSIMGNMYEERKAYVERVSLWQQACKPEEIFVTLVHESGLKIEDCPRILPISMQSLEKGVKE